MINAIFACDSMGGIGLNGEIPWGYIKEDMIRFREFTYKQTVVMGSKTWKSMGNKVPLTNRYNVVVTSKTNSIKNADQIITGDLKKEIMKLRHTHPNDLIWIIGGGEIVEQCFDMISFWYLSRINYDFKCDTFIPNIWNDKNFKLMHQEDIARLNKPVECKMTLEIWRKLNA